jgi:hypothetical protein
MLWHRKLWLFSVVTHEDGRHTWWGSLTYWAHFLACLPTALFVSLCLAGGTLIASNTYFAGMPKATTLGVILVGLGFALTVVVAWCSIRQIGIQQTLHYALQKFERDSVSSWGGCWNQFVPSNLVIGIGSVAVGMIIGASFQHPNSAFAPLPKPMSLGNAWVLALAVIWFLGLCLIFRTGRRSFTEPRWLAHSVREIATYPLTAVPAGLGAIILAESYTLPGGIWKVDIPLWSIVLFVIAVLLLIWQLITLRRTDVLGMSQKPSFAPEGLSVPYLLTSHVFEHTADMLFIALTAPGFYLLGLSTLAR